MDITQVMIMCVLLCYPVSIHMSQLLSTGRPISSFYSGITSTWYMYLNNRHMELRENKGLVSFLFWAGSPKES